MNDNNILFNILDFIEIKNKKDFYSITLLSKEINQRYQPSLSIIKKYVKCMKISNLFFDKLTIKMKVEVNFFLKKRRRILNNIYENYTKQLHSLKNIQNQTINKLDRILMKENITDNKEKERIQTIKDIALSNFEIIYNDKVNSLREQMNEDILSFDVLLDMQFDEIIDLYKSIITKKTNNLYNKIIKFYNQIGKNYKYAILI